MKQSLLAVSPAASVAEDSLVVTFAFRCNLACTFCMVEDVLDEPYPGVSIDRFTALCEDPLSELHGLRRVTFSGGEVTTSKELPKFARLARTIPSVEHVRIQTNATRLRDATYLRSLIDAGVDEFFVSFHGPDRETTDAITQRAGSFEQIVEGMQQVKAAGATLITNTALVQQNYLRLEELVNVAADIGPASIEMWNFWPRLNEGARGFMVPLMDLRGPVIRAMRACLERGIPPVVKWFPRCLVPADLLPYHDDGQPGMLIEPQFWDREPQYGCVYEGVCEEHRQQRCSGVSHTYVEAYGWAQDVLSPRRAESGARKSARASDDFVLRNLVKDGAHRTQAARVAAWLATFDLSFGSELVGWTLVSVQRSRFQDALRIDFRRGNAKLLLSVAARPTAAAAGSPFIVAVTGGGMEARDQAPRLARALSDALASAIDPPPLP